MCPLCSRYYCFRSWGYKVTGTGLHPPSCLPRSVGGGRTREWLVLEQHSRGGCPGCKSRGLWDKCRKMWPHQFEDTGEPPPRKGHLQGVWENQLVGLEQQWGNGLQPQRIPFSMAKAWCVCVCVEGDVLLLLSLLLQQRRLLAFIESMLPSSVKCVKCQSSKQTNNLPEISVLFLSTHLMGK